MGEDDRFMELLAATEMMEACQTVSCVVGGLVVFQGCMNWANRDKERKQYLRQEHTTNIGS